MPVHLIFISASIGLPCAHSIIINHQPHNLTLPSLLLSAAPRPVHGVGLVNIPGGLRSAVLQIPEGEPGHCLGSAGEVSAFDESALAEEASAFVFVLLKLNWMSHV